MRDTEGGLQDEQSENELLSEVREGHLCERNEQQSKRLRELHAAAAGGRCRSEESVAGMQGVGGTGVSIKPQFEAFEQPSRRLPLSARGPWRGPQLRRARYL